MASDVKTVVIREFVPVEVCGDMMVVKGPGRQMFEHKCGGWTWIDGNYCIRCGEKIYAESSN